MDEAAAVLRRVGALLRAGDPPARALSMLPHEIDGPAREPCVRAARLIALGTPPGKAVVALQPVLGRYSAALGSIFDAVSGAGVAPGPLVQDLARQAQEASGSADRIRGSTAGTRLSARLVAGLPVAFALLFPSSRSALTTGRGAVLVAAGVSLAIAGALWMRHLVPAVPDPDPYALLARCLAAGLRAGHGPNQAVAWAAAHPPAASLRVGLAAAARKMRLGATASGALRRSRDPGLAQIGARLESASRLGLPAAGSLDDLARIREESRIAAMEAATRRAPVAMVVPLVLCLLPAFLLVGIVPLLGELPGG